MANSASRSPFVLPIVVAVALAGLLVTFAVAFASNGAPSADAVFTPVNTPAGTPKPNGGGAISGLTDLDVGGGQYRCVAYTAQDSVNTAQVKAAVQCYTYFDTALSGGEPPCAAQQTMAGGPTPVVPGEGNCAGHSGPPPFRLLPPAKAGGSYSASAGGTVSLLTCIEDIGGTLGPNVVAQLTYTGADAFAAAPDGTTLSTTANLWLQQDNATCTAAENGAAPGSTPSTLTATITKRPIGRDFDGDGCADVDELLQGKPGFGTGKCGDDPWNPLDPNGASPDVSGSYDILARAVRRDVGAPGSYFLCKADIQQAVKVLAARTLCYVDDPTVVVNPQVAGRSESGDQCRNAVDDDSDGTVNDGCSAPAAAGDPEIGIQCGNLLDDDNDGTVDDGCSGSGPSKPNPETGAQCLNSTDDDSDGWVNDGCSSAGSPEAGADCTNSVDDDGDGAVNDGCAAAPQPESGSQCQNGLDDDADGVINDGCAYPGAAGGLHLSCPAAEAKYCGDGIPGSAPPGCTGNAGTAACTPLAAQGTGCPALPCDVSQYQFADIDTQHAVLAGDVDNVSNMINLHGCLLDVDGFGALGNVIFQAKINAHTGVGLGRVYVTQTTGACNGPDNVYGNADDGTVPSGSGTDVQVFAARQAPGPKPGVGLTTFPYGCTPNVGPGYSNCRDTDGDGCPDKMELMDTGGPPNNVQGQGGSLRDPMNRWDYFNPEKTGTPHAQTAADILKVVQAFGKNQGNAQYTIDSDRTALMGGNLWNLGPPNGQQTAQDILAAVKQYNHNC